MCYITKLLCLSAILLIFFLNCSIWQILPSMFYIHKVDRIELQERIILPNCSELNPPLATLVLNISCTTISVVF